MITNKKSPIQNSDFKEWILQPRSLFYLIGSIILILYHMQFDLSYGDVKDVYGQILQRGSEYFPNNGNIFQAIYHFSVFHYLKWSSRSVIEAVLIVIGIMPTIFWHLLDIGMVLLIGYCLDKLVWIKDERIKYLSIFTFLMMYILVTMSSAGWIATTTNYSWVMAMGLYVYLNVQRIRKEEHISKFSYALSLTVALYAMNQEQMCGMLLLFLGILLIKDIWDKKFKKALIPFYILNLAELAWILFCPGNTGRKETEIKFYLPIYEEYSLKHKVYEGICSLLKTLFNPWGMIIITFFCVLLLIYLAFKKRSPLAIKIIALIPIPYIILKCAADGFFKLEYREHPEAAALGFLVLICIFITCFYVSKGLAEQFVFLGALCSGAATKIVLGFSIAFYLSGERTSIFFAFTLILASLFLIEKHENLFHFLKQKGYILVVSLLNIALFIWNYYLIVSGKII